MEVLLASLIALGKINTKIRKIKTLKIKKEIRKNKNWTKTPITKT